jgi:hypothetical protein
VTATINAIPTLPIAIDGSRCGTGTINISAIAPLGSTIDWYAASTLGSPLQSSSTSFTTPELTATKYYYAASRDELSGCVSTTRTLVKAVINPLPTLLSPTPRSRCGTGTVMLSAGTYAGSVIDWYSDSTLTNLLATTLNYTTPVISVSTTYYIQARSTTAGCVSAVVPVTATVNSLPQITEVQNGFSCTPGTVLVSATPTAGATIDWYATNVSTVKLATGSNMYLTPSISSTKVYYASARDITTGCVSAVRYAATAEINASLCNSLVDDNDNVSKQTPSASRMNIQDKLLVYPNPTSGRTIIRFTSSKDTDVSLALYNSVGQMVFESIKAAVTGDNQYEIEFSDLSTGFYFLNITDGKELLLTTKVVKQ